jgi:large conductance mechanosensitive channel
MGVLKEFKDFIDRGNVIDLAVGVIIGAAFGKVVASFVSDILMPPVGLVLSGVDLKMQKWILRPSSGETAEIAVTYGAFIQVVIDFLIVAFVIFLVIKAVNKVKKKEAAAPPTPKEPSGEEVLLAEIRDLLKTRNPQ